MPRKTLSRSTLEEITNSTEPFEVLSVRHGVSLSTLSRYQRRRRDHLTELERDQVVQEWLAGIPTRDTCERFDIHRQTVYRIRHAAHELARGIA
jgi:hypothetical protein